MEFEDILLFIWSMYLRFAARGRAIAFRRRRRRFQRLFQQMVRNRFMLSSMNTMTLALMISEYFQTRMARFDRVWSLPRPNFGWFEVMLHDNSQSIYWKEHFRMSKETFLELVNIVGPLISRRSTILREAVSTHKRVAIALWRFATGNSFRSIGAHFDVGKSTCVTIAKDFSDALNMFSQRYIKFPVNCRDTTRAIALFEDECNIPQALGAIDGTHIEIIAPENAFDYFDRQHRYSVIMQAVVGENLMLLDTSIGYPGSMHDARVLRNSELFTKAENKDILKEPVITRNGIQIRPLLLGDGAYPLLPWLLKPYPNNAALNQTQRVFNRTLSSARSTVERAFGTLKGRWRVLLKRLDNRFCNVSKVILTCCILHNFCQIAGEEFDDQEILRRVIEIERGYLRARRQGNRVNRNPAAQAIRNQIEIDL